MKNLGSDPGLTTGQFYNIDRGNLGKLEIPKIGFTAGTMTCYNFYLVKNNTKKII